MEFKKIISNVVSKKDETKNTNDEVKTPVNFNDITGKVFGDYEVVGRVGKDSSGHALWKCRCIYCGDEFITTSYELKTGRKNTTCDCDHVVDTDDNLKDDEDDVTCETCEVKYECPDSPYYDDDYECNGDCEECALNSCEDCEFNEDCWGNGCQKEDDGYYGVTFAHEIGDFTEVPVNHVIAYCLGTDLSMNTDTARKLEEMYSIVDNFVNENCEDFPNLGDVVLIRNLMVMFPTSYNNRVVTVSMLRMCVRGLAKLCVVNNVKYLDMPHICCGRNKMEWEVVENVIKEEFENVYKEMGGHITVTFFSKK